MRRKLKVAIFDSGNIGIHLIIKVLRHGKNIEAGAMVGIDPSSAVLARAEQLNMLA